MQISVIIGIIFKLLSDKKLKVNELAERFEVSQRTVFRYLDVLESAGIPLERTFGKNGGVSVMDSFRLDRSYLSKDERLRIINSLKLAAPNYNDKLSESALEKVVSLSASDNDDTYLLMTDTLIIDGSGWNNANQYRHKISAVNEGIFNNKLLHIRYQDRVEKISERLIEPHTLILKEGVFYLYAFCRERGGFRTFKLARINSVSIKNETFTRRKIDNEPWNAPFNPENTITACFEAEERILSDVEEWLGIPAKAEGGKYYITAKIPDNTASLRKIISCGAGLKVISPDSLTEKIKAELLEITSIYQKN